MAGNFFRRLMPPPAWRFPVLMVLAIFTGLAAFTFYAAKAHSYLSEDPATCVNCHLMAPQYATWSHSSHREWATCNDCHVPHNNVFSHYYFKAMDGLRHATIFTLRAEPQVIFIKSAGKRAVQKNCIRCHEHLITDGKVLNYTDQVHAGRTDRVCWECHRETPHGRVNSLSSVPNARVPLPETVVPQWLQRVMKTK